MPANASLFCFHEDKCGAIGGSTRVVEETHERPKRAILRTRKQLSKKLPTKDPTRTETLRKSQGTAIPPQIPHDPRKFNRLVALSMHTVVSHSTVLFLLVQAVFPDDAVK